MLRLLLRAACRGPSRAKGAELRRAQGSHVPAVLCRAAGAVLPAATRTSSAGKVLDAQLAERCMGITEQGASTAPSMVQ
jgi:hypothetical protein